jgi:hypothetical protein
MPLLPVGVTTVVSFGFPIPVVIMRILAMISIPVAAIEVLSIVMRWHPSSTPIWWPSPISFMPLIVLSYWIPIAVNPHILATRTDRVNVYDTRRRWRTNSDPN